MHVNPFAVVCTCMQAGRVPLLLNYYYFIELCMSKSFIFARSAQCLPAWKL